MFRLLAVLLLAGLPALGAERPAITPPPAPAPTPIPAALPMPMPRLETFRLFVDTRAEVPVRLEVPAEREKLAIRQPGDSDSVISPGRTTPSRQVALKPAIEVNDILLKAYEPDPTVDPRDNRTRGAGAYSPLDSRGRPYQLRFGARLVW